jgi:hypothetical protein
VQALLTFAAVTVPNVPAAHFLHFVDWSWSCQCPGSQLVHRCAPAAAEYMPLLHSRQPLSLTPTCELKRPATQSMHLGEARGDHIPAGHAEQVEMLVSCVLVLNVPAGHALQVPRPPVSW